MEKIKTIVQFYQNLKTNLRLQDQIKQLSEIFPLVWGEDPLFFFDFVSKSYINLNPNFKGKPIYIPLEEFDLTIPNFPQSMLRKEYHILYVYINPHPESGGILYTFSKKNSRNYTPLEAKFNQLSLLMIQNSMRHSYYQFNRLSHFIIQLNQICLSSFDMSLILKRILQMLKDYFPDFSHKVYIFEGKNLICYFLSDNEIEKTLITDKILKSELDALMKTDEKNFIETDQQTVIVKLAEQNEHFGLLQIHSPYYNFWNNDISIYYEILKGALVQTFGRIQLVDEIETERHQLETLIQFKKDITSMIAHDLSSPLMGIMGYLGIIRAMEKDISPRLLEYIDKSYRLTIRLNKLIEDFRLLNHLDDNRLELKFFPVDMVTFVENIIKFYKDLFPCTIHFTHPDGEFIANIDPDYFSRVIENLINNSIKYVGEDVEIAIELKREERYLVIDISDNGPGISEEELDKIFEKYQRGKQANKVSGSGLGLYICSVVTSLHDGTISGKNKSDGKTHFIIKIPAMI